MFELTPKRDCVCIGVINRINETATNVAVSTSKRLQFVIYESVLIVLGFSIAAQVTSAAVSSQVLATLVIAMVTLPLSYRVAYIRR